MDAMSACVQSQSAVLTALPAAFANVSAVFLSSNLPVIPGEWESGPVGEIFCFLLSGYQC